ncbi:MAG: arylsulfatase [Hellea sp.]
MRKAFKILSLLAVLLALIVLIKSVREVQKIGPAKEAVLAMAADLDVAPIERNESSASSESPPNIILILADDMGWRDVGYNHSEIRTPVMDRLAASGIRLNRFYAQPSCSPTRAALMTGKSPLRLGIYGPLSKINPAGLPLSEKTLADHLKAAGYQTALTGKWHLGPRNLAYHPNARGFDHFYGNLTGGVGYYDKVHGGGYDWQRNGETVRKDGYTTRLLADEAEKLIENRDPEKPLFLYVAFGAPHLPNEAPEETLDSYTSIKDKNRRLHAAMVTEMDMAIGEIESALAQHGMSGNTLIWFMSDNGGLMPKWMGSLPGPILAKGVENRFDIKSNPTFTAFARTNLRDGGADNRPFKGGKQSVSEGGVRVPSFLYWPSQIEPTQYNYMATVQDVLPTLLEISEIPSQANIDGVSLWSGLQNNAPGPERDYIVHASQDEWSDAIYRYPYKLAKKGNEFRLFNVEADPLETDNIASGLPEIVTELSNALSNFPRAKNIGLDMQKVVDDPDFFGGKEDREPWADQAYSISN